MISVETAKKLIVKNSTQLPPVKKKISDALNCVLSETITSPISYPSFNQSAMDGFAIRFSDYKKSIPLEIIGESAAGIPFSEKIEKGQAVRIFTGAKVPAGADTVVVQEQIFIENGKLIINDKSLEFALNIRSAGSQIKKGSIALKKGHIVNAGTIGFLASLGIVTVNVFSNPQVTLIITGNELCKPGSTLHDGGVYESNSYCIKAALESTHVKSVNIIYVDDDEKQTAAILKKSIEKSDIVLATGGISVGKYDFVGRAMHQLDVQNIFYKISQKPGKPLFFGKQKACLIFGLPGNPAAALSCFYEYVFPAVRIMQGHTDIFLQKRMLPIEKSMSKKEGLSLFLKGKITNEKVNVLEGQESSNISSFSIADCLIYLPKQKKNISSGELIEIHLLS